MATRNVCRIGDSLDAGVLLTSNQDGTVLCDGIEVAVEGALVSPHGIGEHAVAVMNDNLSETIFINNKPIVLLNSTASCGHKMIEGSDTTYGS